MRHSLSTLALTLSGTTAAAVLGLGATTATHAATADASRATASAGTGSVTTYERGVVLECTGSRRGLDAYVSLYENNLHGNTVQVILDDDPATAGHRQPQDILAAGEVRTGVTIGEDRARIRGTAIRVPVAERSRVHEEIYDAGQHIVADGFHRGLVTDLVLRYAGTTVPLTCDPAFAYRLTVTTTDLTDG